VLALAPTRAEAWHLRGSIWWQLQDYGAAQRDAERALGLGHKDSAPLLAAARKGLGLATEEDALEREVLPRYRPHVVDPPCPALDGVDSNRRVLVIDACITGSAIAERRARRGSGSRRVGRAIRGRSVVDDRRSVARHSRPPTARRRRVRRRLATFGDWTLQMRPAVAAWLSIASC
jgi:hypothetical protein